MATEYNLTWKPTEQRWRKMYRGRWFTFPGTGGKKASYPAAWKAFQEVKQKIDLEILEEADAHSSATKDHQSNLDPNSKEFLLQWRDHLAKRFWNAMNNDNGFQAVIESANLVNELFKVIGRLNSICGTDTYNVIEAIGLCSQQPKYTLFELCQAACFNRSETP